MDNAARKANLLDKQDSVWQNPVFDGWPPFGRLAGRVEAGHPGDSG